MTSDRAHFEGVSAEAFDVSADVWRQAEYGFGEYGF